MPKRSREAADILAEGLDSEWVDCCVMLKPAAAQGKRLPEILAAKIIHVSRSDMTASVLLVHAGAGGGRAPRRSTVYAPVVLRRPHEEPATVGRGPERHPARLPAEGQYEHGARLAVDALAACWG